MPRLLFILAALLSIAQSASAGVAIFDPPVQTIAPGQETVSFDITVAVEELPNFDSVDAIILSEVPIGFEFNPFIQCEFGCEPMPCSWCVPGFPDAIYVGAATSIIWGHGSSFGTSLQLGTLIIDTRDLTERREYEFLISTELDGGISALGRQGVIEPLEGRGVIIVPEPGCALLLLGGAGMALKRGRKP